MVINETVIFDSPENIRLRKEKPIGPEGPFGAQLLKATAAYMYGCTQRLGSAGILWT